MDVATDFTMWALFARATLTVKLVMLILIGASFWCWAIVINKGIQFRAARRDAQEFDRAFWSGQPLEELFDTLGDKPSGFIQQVFVAGMREWSHSHRTNGGMVAGAQSRIERSMDVAIAKHSETLQKGLSVLATVGATAPFIGLFGTVWGIMNAFIEIAEAQNTNLAVVAPGIAEALLATGLGLLAAIPAVIFYNKLSGERDVLIGNYEAFADEFSMIVSRQADQ